MLILVKKIKYHLNMQEKFLVQNCLDPYYCKGLR